MAADTPTWQVRPAAIAAASVWRIAAEGLRLAGECEDAAKLYDGLAGELEPADDGTPWSRGPRPGCAQRSAESPSERSTQPCV